MTEPRDVLAEALGYLDKISPSGWHVERARDVLLAALSAQPEAAGEAGLREAVGELVAAVIFEEAVGRYVCRLCDADVTKVDALDPDQGHEPDCEVLVAKLWLRPALAAPALPEPER